MFRGSWKSTTAGIVALIAAVAGALALILDNDPLTNPDWNELIARVLQIIAEISVGVGLLFTRDDKVTSEEAGAK